MKYTYFFLVLVLCACGNAFSLIEIFDLLTGNCVQNNQFNCLVNSSGIVECRNETNLDGCLSVFGSTTCQHCHEINPNYTFCSFSIFPGNFTLDNDTLINATQPVTLCTDATTFCAPTPCPIPPFVCGLARSYWRLYNAFADPPFNVSWPISENTQLCNSTYLELLNEDSSGDEVLKIVQNIIVAELNQAIGVDFNATLQAYIDAVKALLGDDCSRFFNHTERQTLRSQKGTLKDFVKQSLCLPGQCAGDGSYIAYGEKTGFVSQVGNAQVDLVVDAEEEGICDSATSLLRSLLFALFLILAS